MKKLFVFIAVFVSSVSFSQRDAIDAKNIDKVNEVHNTVINLLTGSVSEKDIIDLGNFIYANKPKNDEIQFVSLINPSLFKLNEDPKQGIDNKYLTESFRILVGKTNVKVELELIEDYYEYLDPSVRTSDYLLNYKIRFKDNNSFGENVDNFIEFDVFVSNCEIFSIIHQIRYF
jgi:hypothetical protein